MRLFGNPEFANAWTNRGFAKTNLGRFDEAIADFQEAIRLDPRNEDYVKIFLSPWPGSKARKPPKD